MLLIVSNVIIQQIKECLGRALRRKRDFLGDISPKLWGPPSTCLGDKDRIFFFQIFPIYFYWLREDTHKKKGIFSGRTTKGVGRINPPDQKNTFYL